MRPRSRRRDHICAALARAGIVVLACPMLAVAASATPKVEILNGKTAKDPYAPSPTQKTQANKTRVKPTVAKS
ncbi:MAG: hypothetical protein AAFY64_03250, partial [Pseudomonadota bacterium]